MDSASLIGMLACTTGGGMGLYGLFAPGWIGRITRLQPDPAFREGIAEFRASFGGLFFASHLFAGMCLAFYDAPLAAAAVGAGWLGAASGRCLSMALDKSATRLNMLGAAFESIMAAALLAPVLAI